MPIYLDHNATTPPDPRVIAEIHACYLRFYGNPSSIHEAGQEARAVVERARAQVARLIGARPDEILFTGGGTEADNLAVLGVGGPVLTTAIEHQAVLQPCRHLAALGQKVAYVAPNAQGRLDPDFEIPPGTRLVSVMLANNDTGVIQPVAALAERVHAAGALLHTDAVQAVGKTPVDVNALGVDLLSISAHKLCGPKGVGALYIRRGSRLSPILFGGHQERGLRPGTENVPAIAGFGLACELAHGGDSLVEAFEEAVARRIPGVRVNGAAAPRLGNTSNLGLPGLDGEMIAMNLDLMGVQVSTGAACLSSDREPSHVLLAMGQSPEDALSSLRFSFGRGNTLAEVEQAVELLGQVVDMLGGIKP